MNVQLKIFSTNHMSFHFVFFTSCGDCVSNYSAIFSNNEVNLAFKNNQIYNFNSDIPRRKILRMTAFGRKLNSEMTQSEKYKKERTWCLT